MSDAAKIHIQIGDTVKYVAFGNLEFKVEDGQNLNGSNGRPLVIKTTYGLHFFFPDGRQRNDHIVPLFTFVRSAKRKVQRSCWIILDPCNYRPVVTDVMYTEEEIKSINPGYLRRYGETITFEE